MNGVKSMAITPAIRSGRPRRPTMALRAPEGVADQHGTGPRRSAAATSMTSAAQASASKRPSRPRLLRPWPRWSMATVR